MTLTPVQLEIRSEKWRLFDNFFQKYPTPIRAWVERQRSRGIRWLYEMLKERTLTAEEVFCLFVGKRIEVPSLRKLNDYWFRAAYRELGKKGESRDDYIKIDDLAFAFNIKPTLRAYDLARAEDRFLLPPPPLSSSLRTQYLTLWNDLISGLPKVPGIKDRLVFRLNKRLSQ